MTNLLRNWVINTKNCIYLGNFYFIKKVKSMDCKTKDDYSQMDVPSSEKDSDSGTTA